MGKVVSYRREQKPLPNELLLMYRQRCRLTQNQLATHLGLKSDRMVQKWESGYTLPTAPRLQSLIELYIRHSVFVKGREQEEARELWRSVKDMFDQNSASYETYPIFDEGWFEQQIAVHFSQPAPNLTFVVQSSQLADPKERFHPARLPGSPNRLIGREEEVKALLTRLTQDRQPVRLLTLTGAGGTGKTRLAIEVAAQLQARFEQVWFVSLTSVQDFRLVTSTVVQALGLKEQPHSSTTEQLQNFLANKRALLVLDNFEHLLRAGSLLVTLLENCPRLVILVTSRVALRLAGEHEFPVAPLKVPPASPTAAKLNTGRLEPKLQYPAITLFVERAQAVKPSFQVDNTNAEAVIEICQRLDGLPLALELAAAWIKLLPPRILLARLIDNQTRLKLQMLDTGGADLPDRQKTIFASIAWSYSLVGEAEKALLRRLAIFNGGWELRAAEEICAGDGLAQDAILGLLYQLVNHSLIVVDETAGSEEPRYHLLETIRQYALVRLEEASESKGAYSRHLDYFVGLAEHKEWNSLEAKKDTEFLELVEIEHANFRGALRWALDHNEIEKALRIYGALSQFWLTRGYWSEAQTWFEECMKYKDEADPGLLARTLRNRGLLAAYMMELEQAQSWYEEALRLYQHSNDKVAVASIGLDLGYLAQRQGFYEQAAQLLEGSLRLFREVDNKPEISRALDYLGRLATDLGQWQRVKELFREGIELARQMGNKQSMAMLLTQRGWAAYLEGKVEEARLDYQYALQLWQEVGNKYWIADSLNNLGIFSLFEGDYAKAQSLLEQSQAMPLEFRPASQLSRNLCNRGRVALYQGNYLQAQPLFVEGLRVAQRTTDRRRYRSAESLEGLAGCSVLAGKLQQAVRLFGAAQVLREEVNFPLPPAERPQYEWFVNSCRDRLDEATFVRLWAEGRTMSLEEVVARWEQSNYQLNYPI